MLISIVTINYNNLNGLKKTISSVLSQTYKEIEYIIIDGGSTDGSVKYLENYSERLAYWISETDNGIYHAMNKGIEKAKGEYLLFLNSGDYLKNNDVFTKLKPDSFKSDLISCGLHVIGDNIDYVKEVPNEIRFAFLFNGTLPHQSTFIKRTLFEIVGYYDEDLEFVSDWKFFLIAKCKYGASFQNIPIVLTNYNRYGISSLLENSKKMHNERIKVLNEEFEPFYKDFKELVGYKGQISALRKSNWIKILIKFKLINKL